MRPKSSTGTDTRPGFPPGIETDEQKVTLGGLLVAVEKQYKAGKLALVGPEEFQSQLDRDIADAEMLKARARKKLKGFSV
jgi:hypothetical protein